MKTLFKTLTKEKQMEIVQTLAEYGLRAKYSENDRCYDEFYSKDFYPNGCSYHEDWLKFCQTKKFIEKETNYEDLQKQFIKMQKPAFEKALKFYLNEVK